jgi:hypothetical protein
LHASLHISRHWQQVGLTLGMVREVVHPVAGPLVGEGPCLACLLLLVLPVLLRAAWPLLLHLQASHTLLVTCL